MFYENVQWFVFLVLTNKPDLSFCLTGHVCSRQKAETYETTYDRAFICPERYTTACGQLDWRRCTKYRVNTRYTPTQKYAVRYYTVEECCPGWRDAGGGDCTLPVCMNNCENNGVCDVTADGGPGCSCSDPYYGNRCQNRRADVLTYITICTVCLAVAALATLAVYIVKRKFRDSTTTDMVRLKDLTTQESEKLLSNSVTENTSFTNIHDTRKQPTAPEDRMLPSAPAED